MKQKIIEPGQKFGLILIALSFVVWYLRPFKSCPWWNLLCDVGSITTSPIFTIVMIVLLVGGVIYLFRLDKLLFKAIDIGI